jgi:hypothetical protein
VKIRSGRRVQLRVRQGEFDMEKQKASSEQRAGSDTKDKKEEAGQMAVIEDGRERGESKRQRMQGARGRRQQ